MTAAITKILVLHGPNLNMLALREPDLYASDTLETINNRLKKQAIQYGYELSAFQSNAEAALIDAIHQAKAHSVDYIIFNPAAYTHTSIALRDAVLSVNIPFIEVHISNIHQRESFRHTSYFSDIALGIISGLGTYGYDLALQYIFHYQQESK